MVSKNQKKLINSLHQKKYRKQYGLFVAEGKKVISELLEADLELHSLFALEASYFETSSDKTFVVTETELKSISFLTTPQFAVAVFYIPKVKPVNYQGLVLALDDIRDPGNLGTIIRLCDWFGITDLVCSEQTVDCFNPKVIQATMGSVTRVNIIYTNLQDFLTSQKNERPIYGTFMDGEIIYQEKLSQKGIIVMGNEANGISKEIEKLVSKRIAIPRFGNTQITESLNVATATAIILNEFRRD
ncbi:RNA methyltransferase [Aquimarina sp. BL5]|uniref:TrmH family RNA methyltransferase n=1 Tax=Aquimarina sp. BL5 TaxID=1714860 RepID=UPI000E4BD999|nr:RNA methyltransferase [Aquimarina sp. BL5]AXT51034.1 RNA methyltransferase [Aquimarina sp. BL5]RKN06548.1 RNA methyltransferase [Aquimarina sp. BL5]